MGGTSNGGVMILAAAERKLVAEKPPVVICDPRDPLAGRALARFGKAAYSLVHGDVIPSSCH
jgi:hypothetical protein